MRYTFLSIVVMLVISSCGSVTQNSTMSKIMIDTLLIDKISIRAISINQNKIWYGADQGLVGYIDISTRERKQVEILSDSLKPEFRSAAATANACFVLNAGTPATLYKVRDDLSKQLVYTENHPKVFYDSMQFWNELEGIAIGDPTDDCLSVIITRDGGKTWQKTPCNDALKLSDGEAAFAASNSNISISGSNTWVVTGGKRSRIFYSADKGKFWKSYETPIVQGSSMTGIFTSDFYNDKIGIIAGGDYEKPMQNFKNKAITTDGGKTWNLIADHSGFGYASCVRFVPGSKGKSIVSVGATGLFISNDSGKTWRKISEDTSLYTIRFIDSKTAIAAGKNKIIRIRFL